MGEIKSALEIALERTEKISVDKQSIEADEYRKKGNRIISAFLGDPEVSLDGCFKDLEKNRIEWVKEGMFHTLLANLRIPQEQTAIGKLKRLETGFTKLVANTKRLKLIFNQLEGFFAEYFDGKKRIREHIEAQYAPRLRQKEEAVARQLGTQVHLDPESDPEFKKVLNHNYAQFENQYQNAIDQVKGELEKMFSEK